jgi:hypothetical protein
VWPECDIIMQECIPLSLIAPLSLIVPLNHQASRCFLWGSNIVPSPSPPLFRIGQLGNLSAISHDRFIHPKCTFVSRRRSGGNITESERRLGCTVMLCAGARVGGFGLMCDRRFRPSRVMRFERATWTMPLFVRTIRFISLSVSSALRSLS